MSTICQETQILLVHTVSVCQLDQFHAGLRQSYLAVSVAAKNTVPVQCQFTSWTSFMLASDGSADVDTPGSADVDTPGSYALDVGWL